MTATLTASPGAPPQVRRYTLHEVAALAGSCYATAWRAARSGELQAERRGKRGHWTVTEEAANEWAFHRGSHR